MTNICIELSDPRKRKRTDDDTADDRDEPLPKRMKPEQADDDEMKGKPDE